VKPVHREQTPGAELGRLDRKLATTHRRLVELHALGTVTLDLLLDPHEDLGIDRLRAGVATPQAPCDRGEEEQRIGTDDQQDRQEEHVLRPENPVEDVKLALDDIEQNGLPVVPRHPAQAIEDQLGRPHQNPPPLCEDSGNGTGIDLLPDGIEGLIVFGARLGFSVSGLWGLGVRLTHDRYIAIF
jgi:hypothetical protein